MKNQKVFFVRRYIIRAQHEAEAMFLSAEHKNPMPWDVSSRALNLITGALIGELWQEGFSSKRPNGPFAFQKSGRF
jgi:hypothetical protein